MIKNPLVPFIIAFLAIGLHQGVFGQDAKVRLDQREIVRKSDFSTISWGFKSGISSSNWLGVIGRKSRYSYLASFWAQKHFNAKFSAQAELAYLREGVIWQKIPIRLDYVAIPVSVQFFPSEQYGFFVEAGAQAGILVRNTVVGSDQEYDINPLDLSLTGGVGHTWNKGFSVGFRYTYGLNTIRGIDTNKIAYQFYLAFPLHQYVVGKEG